VIWLDAPDAMPCCNGWRPIHPREPGLAGTRPPRWPSCWSERRPLQPPRPICTSLQDGRAPEQVAQQVIEALPGILRQAPGRPSQPVALVDSDGAITPSLN
jgi:hypothetical protein